MLTGGLSRVVDDVSDIAGAFEPPSGLAGANCDLVRTLVFVLSRSLSLAWMRLAAPRRILCCQMFSTLKASPGDRKSAYMSTPRL